MKRKISFLITAAMIYMLPGQLHAQDIHFSQLTMSPLTYNPAMTGRFFGDMRGLANYKNQWQNVGSPYTTYAVAYDMKVNQKNGTK